VIQRFEEKCLLSIGVGDDTILSFYDLQIESTNEGNFIENNLRIIF